MSNDQKNGTAQGLERNRNGERKPYEKPAFRYERMFETMALTCGKVTSSQGQCHNNRHSS